MSSAAVNASEIDQQVGERIRRRRVLLGLTQDHLGETLGISYQQIQKYETGANRVSAGRLFQIAQTLQIDVSHFFNGLSEVDHAEEDDLAASASSRNVIDLVRNFSRIEDDRIRTAVLSLVRSLADKGEAAGDSDVDIDNGRATTNGHRDSSNA